MGLFSRKNKQERAAEDSGRFYSKDDDAAIGERARAKRASNAGGAAGRRAGNDPLLPEKKRARRRLVGAIALALAAAVGVPMLLDSQPKPLAGDIAIQIPSKDKAAPLPVPAADKTVAAEDSVDKGEEVVTSPPASTRPAAPARQDTAAAARDTAAPQVDTSVKPEPKAESRSDNRLADRERDDRERADRERAARERADRDRADKERAARLAKAEAEREARLDKAVKPKPDDKPVKPRDDSARALAILEDKPAAKPDDKPVEKPRAAEPSQRFVVQATAVSSAEKAAEVQAKLRAAGIASYTEKSAAGGLIRVRVGPFSRDEAEKMRAKLGRIGFAGTMSPI